MTRTFIAWLTFVPFLASVAYGAEVNSSCDSGLIVSVSVESELSEFRFSENSTLYGSTVSALLGKVVVDNPTSDSQPFSTRLLKLSVNGGEVFRGYKKTVASEIIDFGVVQVEPGQKLKLDIYWPVTLKGDDNVESVVLTCENVT